MSAHTSLIKSEPLPFKHLLAKSSSTPDNPLYHERLHGHTAKVLEVAETLLDEIEIGLLRQLDLNVATWRQKFRRAVLLGAYLHDLGKANSHFQSMLRRQRDVRTNPQGVRHEALTGVLCTHIDQLRSWLCPNVEAEAQIVFQAAICAAVGHHLKTNKPTNSSRDFEITVHVDHADFNNLLRLGQSRLGLNEPPKFREPEVFSLDENFFGPANKNLPFLIHKLYVLDAPKWFRRTDAETQRWLAAVKALVIAADVAGSALPGSNGDIKDWVTEALRDVLSAEELKTLVKERLGPTSNPSRDQFQREVEQSPHRVTLVRAGCGAGKTVAAYKWASAQAANLKLFFCYPTTGTTSEGFRVYVSKSKIEGKLIHSRASVDLENIFSTPDDTIEVDRNGRIHEIPDTRLESLDAWSPPLVICTVDTVLGLMQNNRRGLFSFPALSRSAFVFDEIHSYDSKLFGALLRFLRTFKCAPVLLMTASLPPRMLDALQKVCGRLESIRGPKTREDAPRYRLRFVNEDSADDAAWKAINDELRNPKGGKVLCIANTVDRAVCLYREALRDQLPVLLYHSRFRYFERVGKHDALINAFDKGNLNPVLAITTQVAEMSLDLSANLLVSDLAPPSALIQRLGRLNRDDDEPEDTALAIVLEIKDPKHAERIYAVPYVKPNQEPLDEFMLAYEWVSALPPDPSTVSQAQLADALDEVLSKNKELLPAADSTWLDGEWHSQIDSLRAGDISVPIVLERDVKTIRDAGKGFAERERRRECRKEAIRRSLSIPARAQVNGWKRLKEHGLYRIARDEHVEYNEDTGARWR
jgi:CRISPR-associated endonuclease/helicase Cas3